MNKSIHGLIAAIIFVGLVIALAIYQKPEGRYQVIITGSSGSSVLVIDTRSGTPVDLRKVEVRRLDVNGKMLPVKSDYGELATLKPPKGMSQDKYWDQLEKQLMYPAKLNLPKDSVSDTSSEQDSPINRKSLAVPGSASPKRPGSGGKESANPLKIMRKNIFPRERLSRGFSVSYHSWSIR